jgi:TonB family protein
MKTRFKGTTMNVARMLSFRMPCILSGLLIYGSANPQDAQPTPPVETPVRVDPEHPIRIGENYPALSRKKGEQGLSVVRIEVDVDGIVRATQLVFTSGFAHLDQASLDTFAGARMIPATIDGEPVNTWANIPIAWNLAGHGNYRPHRVDDAEIQVPIVPKSYRLKAGPNEYPSESRATHQEGDCTIRALVDKDGTATEARVSKSTGSSTLDQACVQAIQQAPFIPAHQHGEAISGAATITMSWRLTP